MSGKSTTVGHLVHKLGEVDDRTIQKYETEANEVPLIAKILFLKKLCPNLRALIAPSLTLFIIPQSQIFT